jgi:hypothetical protein
MTNEELLHYQSEIKPKIKAGDGLIFFGSGLLSGLIRLFSSGPSHIAVVRQEAHQNSGGPTIIESTIEPGRNGVQTNDLYGRVRDYSGSVVWLPLSDESRQKLDLQKFYAFCGAMDGFTAYDTGGLFEFFWRTIPVVGVRVDQAENPKEMVCSALAAALWQASGLLTHINWDQVRPQQLVEFRLYDRAVNITGNPKLVRFNTV